MAEGIESFKEFITLENDDIKSLCSITCNPGGLIPNMNFFATPENPDPTNIMNPVCIIPAIF